MKRNAVISSLAALLCLITFPAFAATEGGTEAKRSSQTEVFAEVAVDYMGKLRFEVKDEETMNPIPGASVEIWIPGIDNTGKYILFGVSDEEGSLTIDAVYAKDQDTSNPVSDGVKDSKLYLADNNIKYKVYKADWLPYPFEDEALLELKEIPQIVTVLLHQEKTGGGGTGGSGGAGSSIGSGGGSGGHGYYPEKYEESEDKEKFEIPEETEIPQNFIPKTGVESYTGYWAVAFCFFIAAAAIIAFILFRSRNREKNQKSTGSSQVN